MNRQNHRHFDKPEALRIYLQEQCEEEDRIEVAKQRRPLRPGDQLSRETFVVDGMAFWSSVIIRSNGVIEVWVQRYTEVDTAAHDTTHEGWTQIAHVRKA
ncbi:MAG: hypothetical protein LBI05_11025 [Planctomycetaceae bacterium]|jgi:hypothetical protein|nr:hypothetical protein [Planctomycetaceae bacterium]